MSTMNPSTLTTDAGDALQDALPDTATQFLNAVRVPLRATAFWAAIALPFLYLPLLTGGLTQTEFAAFFGLMFANAVALLVGHNHGR